MPTLDNYHEFEGRHWETGTIRNALAYQGVKAPHTGEPLSEALLMGISGGAVMGYFSFAYDGYDPHVALLSRNTFTPTQTIYERLAIPRDVQHTNKPDKAAENLVKALEDDNAPIVLADHFLLPYNNLPFDEGMWGMFPIVVYSYEPDTNTVLIADRAKVPFKITIDELVRARGRVKADKFRLIVLDPPDLNKLPSAVQKGIFDCIKLYTENPPKGSKTNFGLEAFHTWAKALTNPKPKNSWDKVFPPGKAMYAGLTSAYDRMFFFGHDSRMERDTYADFLDEASVILNRPGLKDAAKIFRESAAVWCEVGAALLPDSIAPFKESRELMTQHHRFFIDKGDAASEEIKGIKQRLNAIRESMESNFPLDEAAVTTQRQHIADAVMKVHDIERDAVAALQDAMG